MILPIRVASQPDRRGANKLEEGKEGSPYACTLYSAHVNGESF